MKTLAFVLLLAPRIVHNSMGGDLTVDYAPNGATLRTMGGDIRIERAAGDVVAKTMGGNIRVRQLEGSLDAGTMGGNVRVEVVGGGSGRSIEISSMGGSLELTLPKDFAADFDVEIDDCDDGPAHHIVSDFPLRIEESEHRRWFRHCVVITGKGRNGSGANRVRLWTAGGEITIRSR